MNTLCDKVKDLILYIVFAVVIRIECISLKRFVKRIEKNKEKINGLTKKIIALYKNSIQERHGNNCEQMINNYIKKLERMVRKVKKKRSKRTNIIYEKLSDIANNKSGDKWMGARFKINEILDNISLEIIGENFNLDMAIDTAERIIAGKSPVEAVKMTVEKNNKVVEEMREEINRTEQLLDKRSKKMDEDENNLKCLLDRVKRKVEEVEHDRDEG